MTALKHLQNKKWQRRKNNFKIKLCAKCKFSFVFLIDQITFPLAHVLYEVWGSDYYTRQNSDNMLQIELSMEAPFYLHLYALYMNFHVIITEEKENSRWQNNSCAWKKRLFPSFMPELIMKVSFYWNQWKHSFLIKVFSMNFSSYLRKHFFLFKSQRHTHKFDKNNSRKVKLLLLWLFNKKIYSCMWLKGCEIKILTFTF